MLKAAIAVLIFLLLVMLVLVYRASKQKNKVTAKLQKLNKDKDHFIGVVSHDLRSPLNSIMVLSGIIADNDEHLSAEEITEYASIINSASYRMKHLIDNMLDANKIDIGRTTITASPTSVSKTIVSLVTTLSVLGNDKGIHTEVNMDENIPMIMADPNALYRILENLLTNAYKFSEKGSTVEIIVTEEQDQIQIAVKDQGPGLTELDRSKLFRKFEKLSANPTANEKSTGLGLFIVKNLVKELNGTILVESEHEVGTTFKVLFTKA